MSSPQLLELVIDSDGVGDDVRAISLALQTPHAKVLAISAVHGCVSVDQAAANIVRTLKANGRAGKVPVFKGCASPLLPRAPDATHDESFFFGRDGLGDRPLDFPQVETNDFSAHEKEHSSLALIRLFDAHPKAILVCLGPLTNVALALKFRPDFRPHRVVVMGGNYYGVGNVSSHSSAEFNFSGDPEAASIVLSQLRSPLTVVPWEAFFFDGLKTSEVDFDAHLSLDSQLARFFKTATWKGREELKKHGKQYAYCDEIAVATALYPEKVPKEHKELLVHVELAGRHTRGQVVVDWMSQLWSEGPAEDMPAEKMEQGGRKPISFVTQYDVKFVDGLIHEAVRRAENSC